MPGNSSPNLDIACDPKYKEDKSALLDTRGFTEVKWKIA